MLSLIFGKEKRCYHAEIEENEAEMYVGPKIFFGGEDRKLRDLFFNELDFLSKMEDRTICRRKGKETKKKKKEQFEKFRTAIVRGALG